jgi:hypothetical protein
MASPQQPPFPKTDQLIASLEVDANGAWSPADATVPGQPLLRVDAEADIYTFLRAEFSVNQLNDAYGILWLVAGRGNISPLHHQAIKGRSIVITESPHLHLI